MSLPFEVKIYTEIPDENWHPSKSDLIQLYGLAKVGRKPKESIALVHQLIWMNYKKESTKDLSYSEYQEVLEMLEVRPMDSM